MVNEVLTRERLRVESHNERARQRGLAATLDVTEWIRTLDHFQWTCAYCAGPYELLEHFIPLELQGETSVINCLPACVVCNARKNAMHPGALSWLAPSALLYIRAYFASHATGEVVAPRSITTATVIERPDAIYTIHDIASKFRIGERSIRRLIRNGHIQGVLIHGVWKFSEADIAGLAPTSTLLTLQEVMVRCKVSERTILRWLRSGQIKSIHMGRKHRFEESEIKAFLDSRRRARKRSG